jgi:hypothetical protein
MRMTRRYAVNPVFEWRLRAALDQVTPLWSPPRYQTARALARPWRLAPVVVAGAATVLLALTATAATGSPNPVVWTQRATTTIESVGHPAEAAPNPEPSPEQPHANPRAAVPAPPTHQSQHAAPTQRPEPSDHPEPTASAHPFGGSHPPSPSPSPKPSSDPEDH